MIWSLWEISCIKIGFLKTKAETQSPTLKKMDEKGNTKKAINIILTGEYIDLMFHHEPKKRCMNSFELTYVVPPAKLYANQKSCKDTFLNGSERIIFGAVKTYRRATSAKSA